MPICPTCQSDMPDTARFCPNCGSPAVGRAYEEIVPDETMDDLHGIGGWLIIIVISLVFSTLRNIIKGINDIIISFDLFSFLEVAMGAFCVICLVLMFTKSRLFPKFYISLLCINLGSGLIALIVFLMLQLNGLTYYIARLIGASAATIIWVTYMLRSKRVKNTFVK